MGLRKSSLAASRGQFLVGISRAPKMALRFCFSCLTTPLVCEGQDLNLEISWGQQGEQVISSSWRLVALRMRGPRVPLPWPCLLSLLSFPLGGQG